MPHKDKVVKKLYMARYHRLNAQKKLAAATAYYAANRDHCLASNRARRETMTPEKKAANAVKRRAYSDEWKKRNPDKVRDRALRHKYKITLDDYRAKLIAQNYGCEICGVKHSDVPRGLCVDHDHSSDKVRDLLCANCNKALGGFQESPLLLLRAIDYLKKWGKA